MRGVVPIDPIHNVGLAVQLCQLAVLLGLHQG
jgi:hypothetical protein